MATLSQKVKLYLEANSKTFKDEDNNIILQNDGNGDYINSWNVSNLTQPTNEQLDAYENKANKLSNNKPYIELRKNAYPEIGDQLDMLWHSIDQDAALKQKYFAFHQAILAVKSKYPK